jgi:hypothetical protein
MRQLPQNMAWDKTHDGLTNYVKLCDANYYWESNGGAFPANRQRYRGDATTKKHTIPVTASYQGYFIPISGLSPDSGGTGTGSLWKPDGNEGILWKAKINPDHYKTVVDPVAGNRPPGASGATTRSITVNETNQNPAACTVEFTKTGKLGHIPQTVSATDTAALHAWLEARFAPAALRAHGNKVTITITAEGGNTRRDTRFNAVKTIIDAKLASLRASHSLAIHPGLDDAGRPRTGSLTLDNIDMATATRRNCVVQLPDANPTDPGSFVGAASATKCPVSLDTYIEVHNEALGLCEQADVLCVFHKASAAGDVCTTMHELGHSYGMAVYSGHDSPPVGMDMPKKVSENEAVNRYKTNGTKGQTYVGHDHSGSHCAYGLSDAQKAQPSYQTAPHGNAAKCVMFGSGGIVRSFCPQCIDLIRGSKITAIPVVKGS